MRDNAVPSEKAQRAGFEPYICGERESSGAERVEATVQDGSCTSFTGLREVPIA